MRAIEDYLLEWETRRQLGEDATPAELCPDSVALQAELALNIALLKDCERLLDVEGLHERGECVAPPLPDIIGRYEVLAELGRGGMGVVWKVWDPELGREAALKMLRPSSPWHDEADARLLAIRFRREAHLLAQLRHESIVPIYDQGLHQGQPYFVMPHVGGGSLAQCRDSLRAAGPAAVAEFVAKVARAVDYAHRKGVLHRDLKPANVIMDDQALWALRASSPSGSQGQARPAVTMSQNSRSRSRRRSGGLPAMMALLMPPIDTPATLSGYNLASCSA